MGRIVRVPRIERFELTEDDNGDLQASIIGQNLETIEKTGWSPDLGEVVAGLPLPRAGDGRQQTLQIRMPPPPDTQATLQVWLRGESKARAARVPGLPR